MDKFLVIAARLLVTQLFIIAGIGKITAFAGTQGYFSSIGLPMPDVLVPLVILVELGGGFALLFGFKTRWVAVVLALFTVASALIAHRNIGDQAQMIHFMKNLAIAGGLLLFVKYGAGQPSMDEKKGSLLSPNRN